MDLNIALTTCGGEDDCVFKLVFILGKKSKIQRKERAWKRGKHAWMSVKKRGDNEEKST